MIICDKPPTKLKLLVALFISLTLVFSFTVLLNAPLKILTLENISWLTFTSLLYLLIIYFTLDKCCFNWININTKQKNKLLLNIFMYPFMIASVLLGSVIAFYEIILTSFSTFAESIKTSLIYLKPIMFILIIIVAIALYCYFGKKNLRVLPKFSKNQTWPTLFRALIVLALYLVIVVFILRFVLVLLALGGAGL